MQTYNLNPDFRRRAPSSGLYCACCQKPIKDEGRAVCVTIDFSTWEVTEGHDAPLAPGPEVGNYHLGPACWKKIKKQPF